MTGRFIISPIKQRFLTSNLVMTVKASRPVNVTAHYFYNNPRYIERHEKYSVQPARTPKMASYQKGPGHSKNTGVFAVTVTLQCSMVLGFGSPKRFGYQLYVYL